MQNSLPILLPWCNMRILMSHQTDCMRLWTQNLTLFLLIWFCFENFIHGHCIYITSTFRPSSDFSHVVSHTPKFKLLICSCIHLIKDVSFWNRRDYHRHLQLAEVQGVSDGGCPTPATPKAPGKPQKRTQKDCKGRSPGCCLLDSVL